MKPLLTIAELQTFTAPQLHTAFRHATLALACTAPGTADRRNSLASLENISRVMARALCGGP